MHWYACMHEPEGRKRMSLLDGPFSSEAEALAAKRQAMRWAAERDPWTDFNIFGVHAFDDSITIPVALMRRTP